MIGLYLAAPPFLAPVRFLTPEPEPRDSDFERWDDDGGPSPQEDSE